MGVYCTGTVIPVRPLVHYLGLAFIRDNRKFTVVIVTPRTKMKYSGRDNPPREHGGVCTRKAKYNTIHSLITIKINKSS